MSQHFISFSIQHTQALLLRSLSLSNITQSGLNTLCYIMHSLHRSKQERNRGFAYMYEQNVYATLART